MGGDGEEPEDKNGYQLGSLRRQVIRGHLTEGKG